ncbi:MAG: class I SAM-dependent methyltransferase [Lachnospiraceae bacterium]|jgi:hypothetical protein|nr:class I SAM-dependent methyltransferase [Lachnospiraceae bacterium]
MSDHYKDFSRYVKKPRWMSYWHQINEVLATRPDSVLLIGVGNGIIPALLKEKGIKVYTFDNDKSLAPDFCGDLRRIEDILNGYRFDTILCCQVLEHIEFYYFEKVLKFFDSIVNKSVIISLPHCHLAFCGWLRVPIVKNIEFKIIIPSFWIKNCFFSEEHMWEIGMRHFSKRCIKKILESIFIIKNTYHVTLNPYHIFYILEKK